FTNTSFLSFYRQVNYIINPKNKKTPNLDFSGVFQSIFLLFRKAYLKNEDKLKLQKLLKENAKISKKIK
ncbi:MAG TPA: hypothetical protein VIK96_05595, partial [Bacilli bacterium]